jgi:hypothetical protein
MLHLRSLNKKQKNSIPNHKSDRKSNAERTLEEKIWVQGKDSDGQQENTTTPTRARRLHTGFDGRFQRTWQSALVNPSRAPSIAYVKLKITYSIFASPASPRICGHASMLPSKIPQNTHPCILALGLFRDRPKGPCGCATKS